MENLLLPDHEIFYKAKLVGNVPAGRFTFLVEWYDQIRNRTVVLFTQLRMPVEEVNAMTVTQKMEKRHEVVLRAIRKRMERDARRDVNMQTV